MVYERMFLPGSVMRKRLDAIVAGEIDPAPGSSNSDILEKTMAALVSGEPMPQDPYGGGLVPRVESMFKELFARRGDKRFEKAQREAV